MDRPMLRAACALALLITLTAPAWSGTGPVAYWKFDEGSGTTTADASGNGNTGTLVNGPSWVTGRVAPNALSFGSPTSTYVNAGHGTSLANVYTAGMTVSAWIKPTGAGGGGRGRIVDKDDAWFFNMNSTNALGFTVDQYATAPATRVSGTGITLNTWQHVVVTWDGTPHGSTIHFYINGVASDGAATDPSGALSDDSALSLSIGNRSADLARTFSGAIDDLRVYNRVLTATEITALADSTPPGAPSGLAVSGTPTSSQINLTWTAATDNVGVTGYLIERCTGATCSNFAQVGTSSGTTFSDSGLTASTTYRYRVRATDANTNLGPYSAVLNATTAASGPDTQPPTAPTGLLVTNGTSTEIDLAWTASTDNVGVTAYPLERCQGDGCSNFAQIGAPTGPSYNDTGLIANTPYSYRVRAKDAANNLSGYSNILNVVTPVGTGTCHP